MEKRPIDELMKTAMESIRDMVDVNTVLGDAITTSAGATIVPISKVSFGFVSGGGEYPPRDEEAAYPFAGGAGAGVSLTPSGFLVCAEGGVRFVNAMPRGGVDRLIEMIPEAIDAIKSLAKCKCESKDNKDEQKAKEPPTDIGYKGDEES